MFRKCTFILMSAALLVAAFGVVLHAQESCGPPPKAAPQRRTAGESFAPLPLPVTPLRRSEKKKEPTPPALVGKVEYGKKVWRTSADGTRYSYLDWKTDPNDINNLLRWLVGQLGLRYRPLQINLNKFSYDPQELPVLYFTGHQGVSLTPTQRNEIKQYILDGGFVFADACCGSKDFEESWRAEMKLMFPKRPLKVLPEDHPLYMCFYQIDSIHYQDEQNGHFAAAPRIEGINIGCRTAVFFTAYDMSCGWDGHTHEHGRRIGIEDARQLGANMVTYVLAYYNLGKFLSTEKVYFEAKEPTRDEYVFGQIVHSGDWDPHPSGAAAMLKYLKSNTSLEVQFKKEPVDLKKLDVFEYPVVYITGHNDFTFSDDEIAKLRNYFRSGGVLLGDSCCGRESFDKAFRREIARVVSGDYLTILPSDHPIYTAVYDERKVDYTDIVKQYEPGLETPKFEGITMDGQLIVLYTKYGFGTGWDGYTRPYARAYDVDDALKLGTNIFVYLMTH